MMYHQKAGLFLLLWIATLAFFAFLRKDYEVNDAEVIVLVFLTTIISTGIVLLIP